MLWSAPALITQYHARYDINRPSSGTKIEIEVKFGLAFASFVNQRPQSTTWITRVAGNECRM